MNEEKKKKLIQYICAGTIALLAFLFIIIPEKSRFDYAAEIKNPFLIEAINQKIQTEKAGENKELFTKEGELFLVFPETELDFTEGKRELLSGKIFWSTEFLLTPPDQSPKIPFSLKTFIPKTGELKMGPLEIKGNMGSALLIKDKTTNISQIYALDHPVYIFFEGVVDPFILPPNNKITINEKLINEKASTIFFSKLKREFQLKRFETSTDMYSKEIDDGEEYEEKKQEEIINFVVATHENWPFVQKNIGIRNIKKIQNAFSIGLNKKKKDAFAFEEFINPFMNSFFSIENKQESSVESDLSAFEKIMTNGEFNALLQRNNDLEFFWKTFFESHKTWIADAPKEDAKKKYERFFIAEKKGSELEQSFTKIEDLIVLKKIKEANEEIKNLKTKLEYEAEKKIISISDPFIITKTRRLLTELLKNEEAFQTEDAFALYKLLVNKELKMYESKDQNIQDELHLECSQDILAFLRYFLEDKNKNDLTPILIKTYKNLDITGIQDRLGITIFNEEDRKLIDLLFIIGDSGVTKTEIERLQQENQKQKSAISKTPTEPIETPIVETVTINPDHIQNSQGLKNFLKEKGVTNTEKIISKTRISQDLGQFTQFEGVFLNNLPLSGTFYYDIQMFNPLIINGKTWGGTKPKDFLKITGEIIKEETTKKEVIRPKVATKKEIVDLRLIQNTPLAIIKKSNVQELFEGKGFLLQQSNIEVMDTEIETFSITNAKKETAVLNFTFNQKTGMVTNVSKGITGANPKSWGAQVFPIDNFPAAIAEELK